jgi:hypothetical protein
MQAIGQKNSPSIIARRHQGQAVSMVTRIESPLIMSSLILLQSITTRFYNNCTIVIKQIIVQLIRVQGSHPNIPIICTFNVNREQSKYIILIRESIEFMLIIKVAEL